ncbi:MAG TPA: TolC family protein [Ferruginibacter sp.]|nr:TolC family protein [Ferruginibacter sp.]
MLKKTTLTFILFCGVHTITIAQEKWNLRTIVEYAMAHNINVKMSEVQAKVSAVNLKQSRLSQIPNANFSGSTSLNSGSNQDPTSFGRITQTYLSAGLQLQTSAEIFNFFSKRNTIAANEWELQAAKANVDKLKNDIALTAANAYLQVLLAKEQENITQVQLQQTAAQYSNTKKLVDAGALPALNALQLEAQMALDSVNYISAKGGVIQNILTLKSYMNIDAAAPFEVETPPVDLIPLDPIAELQPSDVYTLAIANQPLQRANEFRLKAAQKDIAAARGAMYPTLSAFGSLGSGYNNQAKEILSVTPLPAAAFGNVNVNGISYNVFPNQTFYNYNYGKTGFTSQLSDNFRQSIGLSLSVPIFNGGSLKSNYERSKLNFNSLELQKELDNQQLKQDIYQAYNAALIALEKFNASEKSVRANEQTYLFAQKRFDVGMLSTFDLITTQNNLLRAKLEYTINRFDYVFKMKVLEFYKGQGLKL